MPEAKLCVWHSSIESARHCITMIMTDVVSYSIRVVTLKNDYYSDESSIPFFCDHATSIIVINIKNTHSRGLCYRKEGGKGWMFVGVPHDDLAHSERASMWAKKWVPSSMKEPSVQVPCAFDQSPLLSTAL